MGSVYILHITPAFKHARHYVGYSDHHVKRFDRHLAGQGSKLIAAAVAAGHAIECVHVYEDKDRNFERKLKNRGGARRYCPVCRAGDAGRALAYASLGIGLHHPLRKKGSKANARPEPNPS